MADEVNWGRVREWDGSKGCPPVAVGKLCAIKQDDKWLGEVGGALGRVWGWFPEITAYRIPAEFDHLDDNGNPADPFAGYTSAELRAAADARDADLGEWLELLAEVFDASFLPKVAEDVRDKSFATVYGAAARVLRDGAIELLAQSKGSSNG